jgi:4-hydroxythreonine-4-phosphate dehydrogenase
MMEKATIAVSVGCPAGVGPEVSVVAAANAAPEVRSLLVGDEAVIRRAAELRGVPQERFSVVTREENIRKVAREKILIWGPSRKLSRPTPYGAPDAEAGAAQLAWIDEALALVRPGVARAMVTGPVSKHAIATSGVPGAETFRGHTEHLAERLGAAEVVMAFQSENLTTSLVTTHLPLARVPSALTPEGVARSTYWLVRLLRALGKERPRVAIAALNPHAGEGGLLGDEETRILQPGMRLCAERLEREDAVATLVGPVGAETAYRKNAAGVYDGVVAMYHDQATIPCKLVGFGESVNVTLGLPVVRTSVDHGTGHDIAGTGKADARGMQRAMELAATLARAKSPPTWP